MAKFLWHGSYSKGGAKALVEEGGTKRRAGVERAVTAMGGTLEAMYLRSATTTTTPSSTSRTTCRGPR
jgi:hypothetical protein